MKGDPLTIIHGDALSSLRTLESESAQTCVTSPPYWGLRDYGTGEWDGGDTTCDHRPHFQPRAERRKSESALQGGFSNIDAADLGTKAFRNVCGNCGALRVDIQIGLEKTPDEYVARLIEVFREVKRVLRSDGTFWLNLGDSYAGGRRGGNPDESPHRKQATNAGSVTGVTKNPWPVPLNCKPKDLVGIPWMVAFALRADGWYLRSDIIWSKPNPMPESVTDRPTKSHEYIFLLSKSQRYFFDADAVREPHISNGRGGFSNKATLKSIRLGASHAPSMIDAQVNELGRNIRSVWTVVTRPFSDAHFATFPPDLIRPCILAGSRSAGKRCDCDEVTETPLGDGNGEGDPSMIVGRAGFNRPRKDGEGTRPITRREQRAYAEQMKTSPHRAAMATEASTAFEHYIRTDKSGARPLPPTLLNEWLSRGWLITPEPCNCPIGDADIVLDPFAGSGTTGKVAIELGRKAILIEPKAEYVEMIKKRCQTTIGLPLAI